MKPRSNTWKLNPSLLKDLETRLDGEKELKQFFDSSRGSVSNPLILCEAHKCYIRGILSKHGNRIKKASEAQFTTLLNKIHALETKHKKYKDPSDTQELLKLREDLRSMNLRYAKATLSRHKRHYYEWVNK